MSRREPVGKIHRRAMLCGAGVLLVGCSRSEPDIDDGVSRAQRVVTQLLDYSRTHPFEKVPVDLASLVGGVVKLLMPAFERGRVQTSLSVSDAPPAVLADPHGIEQVLTNLLLNALDAMPNGGEILICVGREGAEARVRVRDTGQGIPAGSLHRVFEPFFTTKGGARGTGLGLSVSQGIVERHGGRIEVQSELGHGATFDVFLPLALPVEPRREAAE
jgi:signal transduction histidine kinase